MMNEQKTKRPETRNVKGNPKHELIILRYATFNFSYQSSSYIIIIARFERDKKMKHVLSQSSSYFKSKKKSNVIKISTSGFKKKKISKVKLSKEFHPHCNSTEDILIHNFISFFPWKKLFFIISHSILCQSQASVTIFFRNLMRNDHKKFICKMRLGRKKEKMTEKIFFMTFLLTSYFM
jgi:hypothetical protein